jgi:hypothetical protein
MPGEVTWRGFTALGHRGQVLQSVQRRTATMLVLPDVASTG